MNQFLGDNLHDRNGTPIRQGDTVQLLGEQHTIRRVPWQSLDGPVSRLEIGASCFWLTPFTAPMCTVISAPTTP